VVSLAVQEGRSVIQKTEGAANALRGMLSEKEAHLASVTNETQAAFERKQIQTLRDDIQAADFQAKTSHLDQTTMELLEV